MNMCIGQSSIPFPLLSNMPLSSWRGSLTKFSKWSAKSPSAEFQDLSWDGVLEQVDFFNPKTIAYKKMANVFVPCLLKFALLSGDENSNPTLCKIRSEDHVTKSNMLAIGIDFVDKGLFLTSQDRMRRHDISFALYPTFSQGSENTVSVRLLAPLDKALNQQDYAKAWRGLNVTNGVKMTP